MWSREVSFERTAANAEDVGPLTAKHLSHKAAAVAGASHDLLDRCAVLGQPEDGVVGPFASVFRSRVLDLAETCSVGLRSEECFCRKTRRAPTSPDRLPHRLSLAGAVIVEDHDVAWPQRRHEELFNLWSFSFFSHRGFSLRQVRVCGLVVALSDKNENRVQDR